MFSFPSLTLLLYLHLILPIQPFYIFITGVGNAKTIRAISTIGGITGPLREKKKKTQNTRTQKEEEKITWHLHCQQISTCSAAAAFIRFDWKNRFQSIPHHKAADETSKARSHTHIHTPSTATNQLISIDYHFPFNLYKTNKQTNKQDSTSWCEYFKHFFLFSPLLSYLLGESTAGVKLQATCHK